MINFSVKKDTVMDEELYFATHNTGLQIYIIPKPGYTQCQAMFATKYGSIDSEFGLMGSDKIIKIPNGTAHFLEHKLFDEQDGNVFDKFALLGASANAFTSFAMTAYYFSCTQNFLESLGVLIKFVQNPYFTTESVAKEQGIIGQEIRMYEDNPQWRVFFNMLGALYHNCYVKEDIAGTIETIANIDDKVLYDSYSTFYHPSNMVLFITGEVDIQAVSECIESSLKNIAPLEGDIKRIYPKEPDSVAKSYAEQRLSVAMPLFMIGFKDTNMEAKGIELLKKEISTKILLELLFGKSSPLYTTLYEQGLINDTFGVEYSVDTKYAFSAIEGESKNPQKVWDIIIAALSNADVKPAEYERIKRVIWGRYVNSFNSTDHITREFISATFNETDYFDYQCAYNAITIEDIKNRLGTHLREENAALSVILPIE